VDLGEVIDLGGAASGPPTIGRAEDGIGLFYPGRVHTLYGPAESGKTWLALYAVAEQLTAGTRCALIDADNNGDAQTVARLEQLGVPDAAIRDPDRFRYYQPESRQDLKDARTDAADFRPGLVVIDAVGDLMAMFGWDSNNPDHYRQLHLKVFAPLAHTGTAVIAIDHTNKDPSKAALGASGTAAKTQSSDVALQVKCLRPFTPGRGGKALALIRKDRPGGLRAHRPTSEAGRPQAAATFTMSPDGSAHMTTPAPGDITETQRTDILHALDALDPPPTSANEAARRLNYRRADVFAAWKVWRSEPSTTATAEADDPTHTATTEDNGLTPASAEPPAAATLPVRDEHAQATPVTDKPPHGEPGPGLGACRCQRPAVEVVAGVPYCERHAAAAKRSLQAAAQPPRP
jgi:hypothetical protein